MGMRINFRAAALATTALIGALACANVAVAQTSSDWRRLEALVRAQGERLAAQEKELADQRAVLQAQDLRLNAMTPSPDSVLSLARGRGPAPGEAAPSASAPPPNQAVGAPPPEPKIELAALPEGTGVLTPRGRFVVEPSIDYTQSTANRLVFRGIELVPGVQLGAIEASSSERNATAATLALRYGVTPRLEIEARIPYLYRSDRIELLQQRDSSVTREIDLQAQGLGDVELAARYQLNAPTYGRPIFVASLRAKTDTGSNPFEIAYDQFGVATDLATGSGFWGVEPSVSFLMPSDPAVLYGSIGYFAHLPKTIGRDIGGVRIGKVDPGDSISANFGFGLALNDRLSFSLGYKHSYIFETETQLGSTTQTSRALQVGAFQFGASYVLTPKVVLGATVEVGVTADAPDVRLVLRIPIALRR